jgi:hypothetical protein
VRIRFENIRYIPGLSSVPPRPREYRWGGRRQGRYTKSSYRKQPLLLQSDHIMLTIAHTHNYILLAALIFPKVFPWITL